MCSHETSWILYLPLEWSPGHCWTIPLKATLKPRLCWWGHSKTTTLITICNRAVCGPQWMMYWSGQGSLCCITSRLENPRSLSYTTLLCLAHMKFSVSQTVLSYVVILLPQMCAWRPLWWKRWWPQGCTSKESHPSKGLGVTGKYQGESDYLKAQIVSLSLAGFSVWSHHCLGPLGLQTLSVHLSRYSL